MCEDAITQGESQTDQNIDLDAHFNSRHLLQLARCLTLDEITTLLAATRYREQGLSKARVGLFESAWQDLINSEAVCAGATLSDEAIVVADSFQQAAIAFLHYRQSSYSEALHALHNSLSDCKKLHDEYAYATEIRRIHLVRNIIRVKTVAGQHYEALLLAVSLIRYVDHDGPWPIAKVGLTKAPNELSSYERHAMLDQVLGEITFASTRHPHVSKIISSSAPFDSLHPTRSEYWLQAFTAFLNADAHAFLSNALYFLNQGPSQMPISWKTMVDCLSTMKKYSWQERVSPSAAS